MLKPARVRSPGAALDAWAARKRAKSTTSGASRSSSSSKDAVEERDEARPWFVATMTPTDSFDARSLRASQRTSSQASGAPL